MTVGLYGGSGKGKEWEVKLMHLGKGWAVKVLQCCCNMLGLYGLTCGFSARGLLAHRSAVGRFLLSSTRERERARHKVNQLTL